MWRVRPPVSKALNGLSHLPPLVTQLLANKGIDSEQSLADYMNPAFHDPALLPGMGPAVARLRTALTSGETIGVFGDFDVDGVTGTAIAAQGLEELGATVAPYIPHREDEGHGLNAEAVMALKQAGVSLIITVDCGITSLDEIVLAGELGMDVIVTDHHLPPDRIPPAVAIIDPKLVDSEYPFTELSGAGLAFKLVEALYNDLGRDWSRDLLELVALSTVADLVPLVGENRRFVKEGLKRLQTTRRPGLQALYKQAGIDPTGIDVDGIAFMISPRLNAAGRLDHASLAYKLLTTASKDEAASLASHLEKLNRERQQMTLDSFARAKEQTLSRRDLPSVILAGGEWVAPGIAGLVASRLVDEFSRPAIVVSQIGDVVRASARSVPEFHVLNEALKPCADLFTRYGGHGQAAGFVMPSFNMAQLESRLGLISDEASEHIEGAAPLHIDAEAPVSTIPGAAFQWVQDLGPFGVDNPAPTFLTRNLEAAHVRTMGAQGQHMKLRLKEGRVVWDALAFRQADKWEAGTSRVDVVYTVGAGRVGNTPIMELMVVDFRPSETV